MAAAEKQGVFALIESCARPSPNPVTDLVAHNRAQDSWQQQPFQGDDPGRGENACRHEQRVTRQKEAHEKTGFDEDDGANEGGAPPADQFSETLGAVERKKEVPDRFEQKGTSLAIADMQGGVRSRKITTEPHTIR